MRNVAIALAIILIAVIVVSYAATAPFAAEKSIALSTPSGLRIYQATQAWQSQQSVDYRYLQKSTCALNVVKVLQTSGFAGYATPWAPELARRVKAFGGKEFRLSQSPQTLASSVQDIYGGLVPVGALVIGCYAKDCTGVAGQRHVGIVGEEERGVLYLYHNNYFAPAPGQAWEPGMVSPQLLSKGIRRQWMRSPWLALSRDSQGRVRQVKVLLPKKIGVMNPHLAYVSIAVPVEMTAEIHRGEAFSLLNGHLRRIDAQGASDGLPLLNDWAFSIGPKLHNLTRAFGNTSAEGLAAHR